MSGPSSGPHSSGPHSSGPPSSPLSSSSSGPPSQTGLERQSLSPEVKALNRYWQVIVTLVLALAGVGYLTAVRNPPPLLLPSARPTGSASHALSYVELRQGYRGPNAALYDDAFVAFQQRSLLDAVPPQSDADRQGARERRALRRAYDGAPPSIPHAVSEQAAAACLSCHQTGASFQGKTAPAMSHELHSNCLQCHALTREPEGMRKPPAERPAPDVSEFVGLEPQRGTRAWPGAPPTMPHSQQMRTRCAACHGVFGKQGMRSTHPWRENCQQCHAPSASLEQRKTAEAPSTH